ncbi:hypothetical protein P8452_02070 [Trifolium repens]|nr:hypothetical protein P8452_02070 [Trifolium repens]
MVNNYIYFWTAVELETLHDAIYKHGCKIKLIIKDNTYDSGLDEKSVKQIGKWLRKLALEVLQNRNGGKNSPRGGKSGVNIPSTNVDIEECNDSIKAVISSKVFVDKVSTHVSTGLTYFFTNGLTALVRGEAFLNEVSALFVEDFLKLKPSRAT